VKALTTVTLTADDVSLLLRLLNRDSQFWVELHTDRGTVRTAEIIAKNRRLMEALAAASGCDMENYWPMEAVRV
jgi:predicted deacylase